MPLYFAYGSNMDPSQMAARTPGALLLGAAWLHGWALEFTGYSQNRGGAVANVRRARGHKTLGRLYELTSEHLKRLDRYEGVPTVYRRKTVSVHVDSMRRSMSAEVYVRAGRTRQGNPAPSYLAQIQKAYRELGHSLVFVDTEGRRHE